MINKLKVKIAIDEPSMMFEELVLFTYFNKQGS